MGPFLVSLLSLRDALEGDGAAGTTRISDSKYRYRRDGAGDGAPLVWDVDISVHERGKKVSAPTSLVPSRVGVFMRPGAQACRHSKHCSGCATKHPPTRDRG